MVGEDLAINALSGGVDSSAVTMLGFKALGPRLKTYFIDSGLMREGEPQRVVELFKELGVGVELVGGRVGHHRLGRNPGVLAGLGDGNGRTAGRGGEADEVESPALHLAELEHGHVIVRVPRQPFRQRRAIYLDDIAGGKERAVRGEAFLHTGRVEFPILRLRFAGVTEPAPHRHARGRQAHADGELLVAPDALTTRLLVGIEEPLLNGFLDGGALFNVIQAHFEFAQTASHAQVFGRGCPVDDDRVPLVVGAALGKEGLKGSVLRLSKNCAEISLASPVEILTNLKMNLGEVDEKLAARDFYGKVMERSGEDGHSHMVRFTSVTPEVDAYFQSHRQHGANSGEG